MPNTVQNQISSMFKSVTPMPKLTMTKTITVQKATAATGATGATNQQQVQKKLAPNNEKMKERYY